MSYFVNGNKILNVIWENMYLLDLEKNLHVRNLYKWIEEKKRQGLAERRAIWSSGKGTY